MLLRKKIVILGGAGYVGSILTPYLIQRGYNVTIIDLFIYGKDVFPSIKNSSYLHLVDGDIRNTELLYRHFQNKDYLIHLACISNDPSFDLNPQLGKSINYDSFQGILKALKESSIQRFIYASSSSVYGVSEDKNVTEVSSCKPLTDYSKYKLLCEEMLKNENLKKCGYTIIRPATVCGYAPRLRLDLTVNILTIHALVRGEMTVLGGNQLRPHIYIHDMVDAYGVVLEAPPKEVDSQVFNVGYENRSVLETAELIQKQFYSFGKVNIKINIKESRDDRSYRIDSEKIHRRLKFKPKYSLKDAILGLLKAYQEGKIINPLDNTLYYNIKRMNEINLL